MSQGHWHVLYSEEILEKPFQNLIAVVFQLAKRTSHKPILEYHPYHFFQLAIRPIVDACARYTRILTIIVDIY